MNNIKHIGRLKNSKRRVIVAYRTIPGDPYNCLVVFSEALGSDEHDTLMKLVESASGQQANELADAMFRSYLPDGRNMLVGFHQTGRLQKISTKDVEMTPNISISVGLDELNTIIATQKGISLEDLAQTGTAAVKPAAAPTSAAAVVSAESIYIEDTVNVNEEALSDEDLARKYRGDADRLSKEAANLRRMAEELVPTKKPTTTLIKPKSSTTKKSESA